MGLAAFAGFVVVFGCLLGLLALVAAPIVLALFLAGMVLRLAFFVLLLPFRLAGGLLGVGLASLGLFLRGVLVFGGLALLLLLGLLPLLPFLLIGAGIYLVIRGMRHGSAPPARA